MRQPILGVVVVLLGVLLTGCTSGEAEPAPEPADPPRLSASVTQFRHDEGTRNVRAGVTNRGRHPVTVTAASIAWGPFAHRVTRIEPWTLAPGETAGFTMQYGEPRCARRAAGRPRLAVEVDGNERLVPLKVEDPELLERLHGNECAQQRLDEAAAVSLRLADAPVHIDGQERLRGEVVLERQPDSRDEVTVVDLGGSVLLRFTPRDALPSVLEPDDTTLRVPVVLGSAHRCDAHALSNSSQTFLLSVYVRLSRDEVHRVVVVPDERGKQTLNALIRDDCQ